MPALVAHRLAARTALPFPDCWARGRVCLHSRLHRFRLRPIGFFAGDGLSTEGAGAEPRCIEVTATFPPGWALVPLAQDVPLPPGRRRRAEVNGRGRRAARQGVLRELVESAQPISRNAQTCQILRKTNESAEASERTSGFRLSAVIVGAPGARQRYESRRTRPGPPLASSLPPPPAGTMGSYVVCSPFHWPPGCCHPQPAPGAVGPTAEVIRSPAPGVRRNP